MSNPTENGVKIPERLHDLAMAVSALLPPMPEPPEDLDEDEEKLDEFYSMEGPAGQFEAQAWDTFDTLLDSAEWEDVRHWYFDYSERKEKGDIGDMPDVDTWLSNYFTGTYSFSI